MADQASASTSSTAGPGEITVNVKCPADIQPNKLSVSISPDKTVVDLKEAIAEKCDLPKERQKLIFSGKVLKDDDVLSTYKMQTGHTLHLLRTNKPPETPAASAQVPRLPQMGTGLNVASDPIDGITNVHHGLAGFNPFANMQGLDNLNDPNAMTGLMNNPDFLRHVADTMQQPGMLDQIINSNPQLASMGPRLRATLQSPMFREIMSNPEALRSMMQMQQAMGGAGGMGGLGGMGGMGGMGGLGGFPGMGGMFGQPSGGAGAGQANRAAQPGQTPTSEFPNLFAPNAGQTATPSTGAQTGAAAGQTGAQQPNPFAALMGGMGNFGGADGTGAGAGAAGAGTGQQPNPFAALLGPNPFLGNPGLFGGAGFAPPPQDTRPPEEIYATQLGQLNAMGLWDAQKNIRALRSTGGNVEAAIELIFSGQLDGTG